MNIETANRIMADKCGVEVVENLAFTKKTFWREEKIHDYKWTIEDARCREIVREKFHIITSFATTFRWRSAEMKWRKLDDSGVSRCIYTNGETISSAEIACILAICEALADE